MVNWLVTSTCDRAKGNHREDYQAQREDKGSDSMGTILNEEEGEKAEEKRRKDEEKG